MYTNELQEKKKKKEKEKDKTKGSVRKSIPLTNCRTRHVASVSPVNSFSVPVKARCLILRGPQVRNLSVKAKFRVCKEVINITTDTTILRSIIGEVGQAILHKEKHKSQPHFLFQTTRAFQGAGDTDTHSQPPLNLTKP